MVISTSYKIHNHLTSLHLFVYQNKKNNIKREVFDEVTR